MEDASDHLLARWRQGDQQAATDLFERYAERLIALADRRLPANLALRVDAEDVVQSVYRSFFVAARQGRYVLQRSGDLWRLLVSITLHKVHRQVKRHTAGKRALQREQKGGKEDGPGEFLAHVLAKDPAPEEAVALADLLGQLLTGFGPLQRRMIELRLEGYLLDEIAATVGRCRLTVLRVLDRFKEQLEQQYSPNSG